MISCSDQVKDYLVFVDDPTYNATRRETGPSPPVGEVHVLSTRLGLGKVQSKVLRYDFALDTPSKKQIDLLNMISLSFPQGIYPRSRAYPSRPHGADRTRRSAVQG